MSQPYADYIDLENILPVGDLDSLPDIGAILAQEQVAHYLDMELVPLSPGLINLNMATNDLNDDEDVSFGQGTQACFVMQKGEKIGGGDPEQMQVEVEEATPEFENLDVGEVAVDAQPLETDSETQNLVPILSSGGRGGGSKRKCALVPREELAEADAPPEPTKNKRGRPRTGRAQPTARAPRPKREEPFEWQKDVNEPGISPEEKEKRRQAHNSKITRDRNKQTKEMLAADVNKVMEENEELKKKNEAQMDTISALQKDLDYYRQRHVVGQLVGIVQPAADFVAVPVPDGGGELIGNMGLDYEHLLEMALAALENENAREIDQNQEQG